MRAISAIAGTIVIAGALGVAVAQSAATVEANSPLPTPGVQEMTAGQMLNYMKEQGTKYIVETTDIPKDKKFEINLDSTNPDEVAKAVAKALDLRATKEGNVWVFKNQDFMHDFHFDHDFDHDFDFDFEMPDMDFHMPMFDGEMFKGMEGKDWDQMTPEEKAKFEKAMKEFGEHMKQFGEKMGKMKIELKGLDGKAFKFDGDTFKQFDGKNWKDLSPEEKAKLEKEMAQLKKELKDMKIEIDGKSTEEFKREMERMKQDLKREIEDGVRIHIENTDKLINSVTDKQWELMKKQGHLKLSDLTPQQRELLGNPKGGEEFNVTIQRDGKKLVIRN